MHKSFLTTLIICSSMIALDPALAGKKGKDSRVPDTDEKKPLNFQPLPQTNQPSSQLNQQISQKPAIQSFPSSKPTSSSSSSKLVTFDKQVQNQEGEKDAKQEIPSQPNLQGVIKLGSEEAKKKWEVIKPKEGAKFKVGKWNRLLLKPDLTSDVRLERAEEYYEEKSAYLDSLAKKFAVDFIAASAIDSPESVLNANSESDKQQNQIKIFILKIMKNKKQDLNSRFEKFKSCINSGNYDKIGGYSVMEQASVKEISVYVQRKENTWKFLEDYFRLAKSNDLPKEDIFGFMVGAITEELSDDESIENEPKSVSIQSKINDSYQKIKNKQSLLKWAFDRRVKWNSRLTPENLQDNVLNNFKFLSDNKAK